MTGYESGDAIGARPGAGSAEAWLGYTLGELTQIARRAAVYCRWGDRFALPERFEIAWTGVVDHLAGCDSPPEPFEVYKAGMRAISRTSERELREHGVTRTAEGLTAMPRFEAYWAPRATPGPDARVVERVALWQIWAMLRPLHQLALLALAAHGDYAAAAQAAGYSYTSYTCLISEARTAFFALWHEGEAPSRIWATDQGGDGDIEDRVRHVLAARRRTAHAAGRYHDQDASVTAELPGSGMSRS